jgi:hypothetical protein
MPSGEVSLLSSIAIIFFQNRSQGKKVDKTTAKVETVTETLTTTNGGEHVKDQLNRIENYLESQSARTDRLDRAVFRIEENFNGHVRQMNENHIRQNRRLNLIQDKLNDHIIKRGKETEKERVDGED